MGAGVAAPVAHLGPHEAPLAPAEAWSHWAFDPLTVLAITALASTYVLAALELRGSGALGTRHLAAFAAGWLALVIALCSPIEALSGSLLSAHMAQHVLLVAIAAPLLAYGMPVARMAGALPRGPRRWVLRLRLRAGRLGASAAIVAAAALAGHAAVLWSWHVPGAYEATIGAGALHAAQHALFLGTALAVWWAVLELGAVTRPSGASIAVLFLLGAQGAALGALMTFAAAPWYEPYAAAAPAIGSDPLADQQLAGLVMWGFGGLGPVIVGAALFAGWLERLGRRPPAVP